MSNKLQLRRDTAANWESANPVLAAGEIGLILDNNGKTIGQKIGDGVTEWNKLNEFGNENFDDTYPEALFIADAKGNVILSVDSDGVKTTRVEAKNLPVNDWGDKVIATYGDSVTALNGGDFSYPYDDNVIKARWGTKIAKYLQFSKIHNRGIGSTTFNYYNPAGGQIAWCKKETGEFVDRNDNYTYDNYEGNVTIPDDCTPIRGCGSSWLRITSMFNESFKDSVDVVLIMFHNDFHQDMDTECQWVENSTSDAEWAASEYYSTYNGDYNLTTVKGGIASTIMKLQTWMPQALLVLMTPISGVHINNNEGVKDLENGESVNMKKLAETVKDIAFRMSIPCIDVYGTDCINVLNHNLRNYITDGIHPYSDEGCKQIARAIISGLKNIVPNL